MSWHSVEVGLAGGEETVTFGPRNETGSALYQVDTLACISPTEKVEKLPPIYSTSTQDGFCMAVSKQVLLFNSSCTVLHATLNFDYDVDRAALSQHSTFAAIGDRSGNFHFLHISTKQILFSKQLVQCSDSNTQIFCDIKFTTSNSDEGSEGLVILTHSGLFFEFSCLRLAELHQAILAQDFNQVKELKQTIITKCSNIESGHREVLGVLTATSHDGSADFLTYGKSSSLAIWGTDSLNTKNSEEIVLLDAVESLMLGSEVIKACTTSDGNFLVILDDQHMLSLWDLVTLTMVAFWHFLSVDDFLLTSSSGVQTNTASSGEEQKIIIVTRPANCEEKRFLQVYTLPTMKLNYSLQVSDSCFLAHSPLNQETIYFTEGIEKKDDNDDCTIALTVRCLTEALPENRFYRLLHKHQFDAAEKFAKQFNMDAELVYKVKANTLLDKVSQWSNNKDHNDFSFDQLKECLSKIKEDDYVINCCLQAVLPSIEETYILLQYARERASKKDKMSGTICFPRLLNEVLALLDKLVTFENAYGIQQFSGSRWHSFCHADLLAEVRSCFGQGEVSSAVTIWRKHQSLFAKDFTSEKLESLLGSIGPHLPSSLIIPWLRDCLVPFVSKVLPKGIDLLALWLDQRARQMELSEKRGWPANALELARVLPAPTYDPSARGENSKALVKEAGLVRLTELVHHLNELLQLHSKYSCRISLAEYTQETTKTIVFRLLDSIRAAELIPQAMKKYIGPYMIHFELDKDQVLLEYIKEMFQKISSSYLSNSLWEPRVLAVMSYIEDKNCYCQATLNVMINASVPWTDAVTKLVQDTMSAYPNNLELQEQYRFVELKKVLRRYNMKSTQAPVAAKAKSIVRVILNRDEPSAVQDALKVVRAYNNLCESDVYVFRLQRLCLCDRADECMELLNSLPKCEAADYVQEIITWLCVILQQDLLNEIFQESSQKHIIAAQNAVKLLKYIKKRDLHTYHEVDDMLLDLSNISSLQKTFSEFLSLDEYEDPLQREGLIDKYLNMYLQKCDKEGNQCDEETISFAKLVRLCHLLGVNKEKLMFRLVEHALSVDDTHMALEICRDLLEYAPEPSTLQSMYTVMHDLCEKMANGAILALDHNENTKKLNLTKEIHTLLCQTLNQCEPALLCDCLEFCKLVSLANEVYAQCETGDYGFSVKDIMSRKDLLSDWSFGKRFKEDGLVLDSSFALPLAAKFCMACIPEGKVSNTCLYYQDSVAGRSITNQESQMNGSSEIGPMPSPLIQVSSAGLNIIRYLQENNLYKLALRYVCETIGICHQHFAANSLYMTETNVNNSIITAESQHLSKISQMALEISKELTGGLLVKVFNHKTVDHDLGLGYICAITKEHALEKLKSKKFFPAQNYTKLSALADVIIDFTTLTNEPKVLQTYRTIKNNALWGQKLSKMKIYIKDVYQLDREEIMHLLPELIKHKDINIELLLDFCRSFFLIEEDALLMYVQMQLLPPVAIDTNDEGDNIAAREYEVNVQAVVPSILSESLIRLLVDVCTKIDPYDYDRIMFILNLCKQHGSPEIVSLTDKGIRLLEYLYLYERKAKPSKYEKMFSHSDDKDKVAITSEKALSHLSKKRLPFHPMLYGDPWKVISAELSEETVPKLIGVAKLLKLSTDQMYLTAIQNLFKSPSGRESDSSESIDVSSDALMRFDFEMARGLLYSVKNKEMAIAAAKWISQQLPLGEEKIKVLEACVDLANDWKNNCSAEDTSKTNMMYDRLKKLSKGVATEYVLHKYNIAEQSLIALVTQPAKLICQLYQKYGAREVEARSQPPDINKASDQIAVINNASITKIRLYLIEKWLPSTPVSAEESYLDAMNQTIMDSDEKSEDAENLKRVIYMLQNSPPDHSVMFLLNFAYTEMSSTNITCKCRLRSLHVLFAIYQDDVIEDVSKKAVSSIRQYMKSLTYLAEFEALHIQQSLSAFQKCSKEGLVRGLWRNHNHEKRGVRLVAGLCLDNEIYDPQLWNSVLMQMLSFGMVKYLGSVLVSLAAVPDLWLIPCLPSIWKSVILAPFKIVSPPLSDEEMESCMKSAALLQSCPFLNDLDLVAIAQHFHRVGLHAFSLACLVLVPFRDVQRQKVKELLDTKCSVDILDQLQKQCENAQTLGHVKTLQEEVYQYVENNQDYQVLLGTNHFDGMISYLINTDQIEGLLMKTLKSNRLKNAENLVHLYHQVHPASSSGQFVSESNEPLSTFEELWAFLESRQMLQAALPYLPQLEQDQTIQDKQESILDVDNSQMYTEYQ